MHAIGLDIGGANVKAADTDGRSVSRAFEIWKAPDGLTAVLQDVLCKFSPADLLAVTMTAELADCFQTKAEGVDQVLCAVEAVADGTPVFVWQTGAEFVSSEVARDIPLLVAAANWHALASWVGRLVPDGPALLIDVGSTTTDVIPLLNGVPVPRGLTDCQRLQSGELVYSGVRRTPVCAIAHSVPVGDGYCPLAAEWFATTLDIYLLLGDVGEDADDLGTANGRPATRICAHDRLARAVCCDRTELSADTAEAVARFLADVQRQRIASAVDRVVSRLDSRCRAVLISGSGSFLAERIAQEHGRLRGAKHVSLSAVFDAQTSHTACAAAVARLAAERLPCRL